jgi:cytoskeletal protein RodZ
MATVGEQLRAGRTAQQLTIRQIAEGTKIRSDYLEALESGDYNRFVAPVYIRGFVRTYATLLRLDVPTVMAALDEELGQSPKFKEDPSLRPAKRGPLDVLLYQISRINWPRTGLALLLLLLVAGSYWAISAWRKAATSDPLAGVKPQLYEPATNRLGSDTLPLPPPQPAPVHRP